MKWNHHAVKRWNTTPEGRFTLLGALFFLHHDYFLGTKMTWKNRGICIPDFWKEYPGHLKGYIQENWRHW
jgi:hypothetical protein